MFLEAAAALSSAGDSLEQQSVCLDSQACQELNMSGVRVALLRVVSPTLGSVPRQRRLQCSLLTGHLSDDEMMSVLGGARRKARPRRWQGIQMHSPMYPPVLGTSGEAAACSVLLCQSPELHVRRHF